MRVSGCTLIGWLSTTRTRHFFYEFLLLGANGVLHGGLVLNVLEKWVGRILHQDLDDGLLARVDCPMKRRLLTPKYNERFRPQWKGVTTRVYLQMSLERTYAFS